MNLGKVHRIKIDFVKEPTQSLFRFSLQANGFGKYPVEFETDPRIAIGLMKALQRLEVLGNIQIPPTRRATVKPTLRIVPPSE